MGFFRKHWWEIWYIGSITLLVFVSLIVASELPCLGYNGPGCADFYTHRWSIGLLAVIILTNAILAFRAWKTHAIPRPPQPYTWHSTYALPLSFILFFILAGVFLGEQLPALPTYLGDITRPDNKPSILDVGSPGDTGVVFVIYTVFGAMLWLLFRWLNWRLVWVTGAIVGLLAEWFLFQGKSGNLTFDQNPIGSTIFLITVWSVISVVPYITFRSVDRRWGSRGRWLAIVIILLLNVLATGFFAYQKFVLHREYVSAQRGRETLPTINQMPKDKSPCTIEGSQARSDTGTLFICTKRGNELLWIGPVDTVSLAPLAAKSPPSTNPSPALSPTPRAEAIAEKSLITPYSNESDIASINEAFSTSKQAPWGFQHGGIDLMTAKDLVSFRAVMDGTINNVQLYKTDPAGNWQVGLTLQSGSSAVIYGFETFSADEAVGKEQLASISVQNGQGVKQGDAIGALRHGASGTHVHFGVVPRGSDASGQKCPEPYFTDEAKVSILSIIHKDHPNWQMCY